MSASKYKQEVIDRLRAIGISYEDAVSLRRISMTLHRWHEWECGTDAGCIERDESSYICTQCGHKHYGDFEDYCPCEKCGDIAPLRHKSDGAPYFTWERGQGPRGRMKIADKEKGALKRLKAIMMLYPGFGYYVQGDPRGAALYIFSPSTMCEIAGLGTLDAYYTRGVAVYR